MNHFRTLKDLLEIHRLYSPEKFFNTANKIAQKLPLKIPVGEWVSIGGTKQFIVFPYEPVNSALRGGIRVINFLNYPELRQGLQWRWEYFHDHGDAVKIGKKGGLYIYEEDPIMVPGIFIGLIYYLVFKTQPSDYLNLKGERQNVKANF